MLQKVLLHDLPKVGELLHRFFDVVRKHDLDVVPARVQVCLCVRDSSLSFRRKLASEPQFESEREILELGIVERLSSDARDALGQPGLNFFIR
jgi:hypothetical protein